MSNILAFRPARTLATVLAEIDGCDAEIKAFDLAFRNDPTAYVAHNLDQRCADADSRLSELRREAERMIEAATGSTWDNIRERLA